MMRIGTWRPWTSRTWLGLALAAALAAAAPAARAEPIDDAQAAALERQLHDWLAALLGPGAGLPDRPVQVRAEGDHDHIAVPLTGRIGRVGDEAGTGVSIAAAPLTAEARPLDGGRWALDDIRLPSPLAISTPAPQGGTITWTATTEAQDQHALLDPTLATASRFDSTLKGYQAVTEQPEGVSRSRVEQLVSHGAWLPDGDGRGALSFESESQYVAMNADMPPSGPLSVSVARSRGALHAARLAPDRLGAILRALASALPAVLGKPSPDSVHDGLPDAVRAALHSALVDLDQLASGFDEEATLTDLRVRGETFSGHADRVVSGFTVTSAHGKLSVRINLALDGLDSPQVPPGPLHDLLPRHIVVTPRIGGVPAADLQRIMLRAVDGGGEPPSAADAEALLSKGPVVLALDELALDAGPASLTGSGTLSVAARNRVAGSAHLSATGLDALIRRAGETPLLQRAVPVLFLLKGIGTQQGDSIVWNVVYRDGKVTVNGSDLSKLMPKQ